jgi:hypothetical protein
VLGPLADYGVAGRGGRGGRHFDYAEGVARDFVVIMIVEDRFEGL